MSCSRFRCFEQRPVYHKFGDEESVCVEAGGRFEALNEHALLFAQTDNHITTQKNVDHRELIKLTLRFLYELVS